MNINIDIITLGDHMLILLILSLLKIFQVLLFRVGTHMKKHQYLAYRGGQYVFNLNNVFFATVK